MPDLAEALTLVEVLGTVALLVCLFMVVNNAALAASDAVNRRRSR